MSKQLKVIIILSLVLLCGNAYAALFSIANPKFSSFVDRNDNYKAINPEINGMISRKTLKDNLLYFSVTIVGDVNTYEYLKQHSHLELEVAIWADGVKKDSVPIGMTTRDWDEDRQRLKYELDNTGLFTWRTYMNTVKIWYSEVELVLRDDNNRVVKPVNYPGSYRAKVKLIP